MSLSEIMQMIPAKYRKWLYLVLGLAGTVYGIVQATHGDWAAAATIFFTSTLPTLISHSNVPIGASSSQSGDGSASS